MSTESASSALQRFARDLRRIREQREISLSALNEATQVPKSHIQEFEEGSLYEQSRMNAVYLKAFVRAYAEILGIPPDAVVQELEAALDEEYDNQLAVQFLEGSPSESREQQSLEAESPRSSQRDQASGATGDSHENTAAAALEDAPEEDASSGSATEDQEEASDRKEEGRGQNTDGDSLSSSTSSPRTRDYSPTSRSSSLQSSSSGSGVRRIWNQYAGVLTSAFLILLVLAVGIGVVSYYFGGEGGVSSEPATSADLSPRSAPPDTTVSADTVETDTGDVQTKSASSSPAQRPLANVTLGDTLYAAVEATSVVAGMRVQQDDDLRRPYWIEEGDVRVFPFTRRITFENQLDSLRLFLENYPYPTTRTNEEGRIIISRDSAETFVDTLRGTPASFPTPYDTVQIGPVPSSDADTLAQIP